MRTLFATALLLAAALPLLVGASFVASLRTHTSRLTIALQLLPALVWTAFAWLLARHDVLGTAFDTFMAATLVALAVARLAWARRHPGGKPASRGTLAAGLGSTAVGAGLCWFIAAPPEAPAVPVHWPLQDVSWVVTQGGTSGLTNHHSGVPAQRHALDVSAVDTAGRRAAGVLPLELSAYAVYGANVGSPCDGTVTVSRGDLPDRSILDPDRENVAGNHVVVACAGTRTVSMVLAHLQPSSVTVNAGDRVHAGQLIGRVGNSGHSSEPHLHVHAVASTSADLRTLLFDGEGLPLSVDGRSLRRGQQAR